MSAGLHKEKGVSISIIIEPKYLEEFVVLIEYFIAKVRKEEGNIFYYVMVDRNEKNKFIFFGLWEDKKAIQTHTESDYFKNYVPQLGRMYKEFRVTELDRFL